MAKNRRKTKHLVVVGAGFAGYWAALAARYAAEQWRVPLKVTVINPTRQMVMRPRLYEPNPHTKTVALEPLLKTVDVDLMLGQVDVINSNAVTLTQSQHLEFDALVIASGSLLSAPEITGVEEHSHQIDDLPGAIRLDNRLKEIAGHGKPVSVAILGAGFTGIELACELRSRLEEHGGKRWAEAAEISLIDRSPYVGATLGEHLTQRLTAALSAYRIDLHLAESINEICHDGVKTETGLTIPADITVICTGSKANHATISFDARYDEQGRLIVDSHLAVSDRVFAAGDCARALLDRSRPALMSCQHAMPMGRFAGYNAASSLFEQPMLEYEHSSYITCLDLGPQDALVTRGWDRLVEKTGRDAKAQKKLINEALIYPRLDTRLNMLAAAAPVNRQY